MDPCKVPGCFCAAAVTAKAAVPFGEGVRCQERCSGGAAQGHSEEEWGRQGWRPVCLIWVCDHIQVWGSQLRLAKGGSPPWLGLGMPRAQEYWEDTHTTVCHGGWA